MKVLVIGGGGREHAIIWKLAQSKNVSKIYCAPGNGGIADLAECVPIDVMDFEKLTKFAKENNIDLTVVAPDDPLAAGAVDAASAFFSSLQPVNTNADAIAVIANKFFNFMFFPCCE